MTAQESGQLLRDYAHARNGDSFRRLVEGHKELVKKTALRQLNGDSALAEDVSQIVFAALAVNPRQVRGASIAAWLQRVTKRRAVDAIRTENRRRQREQSAASASISDVALPHQNDFWLEASPVIESCLNALSRDDHQILMERFWQKRDLRTIGESRNLSDNAVQKRISRLLAELRSELHGRGILGSGSLFSAVFGASFFRADAAGAVISGAPHSIQSLTQTLIMTAQQKVVWGCSAVLLVGIPVYQQTRINALKAQVAPLTETSDFGSGVPKAPRAVAPPLVPSGGRNRTAEAPPRPEKISGVESAVPSRLARINPGKSPRASAADWQTGSVANPPAQEEDFNTAVSLSYSSAEQLAEYHGQRPTMPNGHVQWDHGQATGAPDTTEAGDRPTAWAPRSPRSGEQWLQLGYGKAVELHEINIHESHNSGAVSKVTAIMPGGEEKTLWTGSAAPGGANEILETAVPVPPGVTTGQIKVYVDTNRVESWPEIDAVEVVGTDGSRQWAKNSAASNSYSESYGASFSDSKIMPIEANPRSR